MTEPDRITFEGADPRREPAAGLLGAMAVELNALYGTPDRLLRPALSPRELAPPAGAYLVGRRDGVPVAGGGLRRLAGGVAEVKRMYVTPEARHQGVAAALLAALERAAAERGYHTVRLDTGPRQPHALALYARAGYRTIAPYNDNPYASYWGDKVVGAAIDPGDAPHPGRPGRAQ